MHSFGKLLEMLLEEGRMLKNANKLRKNLKCDVFYELHGVNHKTMAKFHKTTKISC